MTARLLYFIDSNQENLISTFDLSPRPPAKEAVPHAGNLLMIQPLKSNIWRRVPSREATDDIFIVYVDQETRSSF